MSTNMKAWRVRRAIGSKFWEVVNVEARTPYLGLFHTRRLAQVKADELNAREGNRFLKGTNPPPSSVFIVDRDGIKAAVQRYFADLHSSTWGGFFSIDGKDREEAAVEWLASEIENVLRRL